MFKTVGIVRETFISSHLILNSIWTILVVIGKAFVAIRGYSVDLLPRVRYDCIKNEYEYTTVKSHLTCDSTKIFSESTKIYQELSGSFDD